MEIVVILCRCRQRDGGGDYAKRRVEPDRQIADKASPQAEGA